MSRQSTGVSEAIANYLDSLLPEEPPVWRALREETAAMPDANMQISAQQANFMRFLLQLIEARRTIEIGVFTGYSSLITAAALPADGQVLACDINAEYTAVAQRYWQQAGVADKIDLRLAPALQTLDGLLAAGQQDSFDFAFIDADKTGYAAYYERCLQLVRPGGLILFDNALWGGSVAADEHDADTDAIRELNLALSRDARVNSCLAVCGDGVHLVARC